ncbi:MAG: hypothetical protein BroJett018_39050 [Chloroflexota bacterium]|nr:MAG: hypothetical protein BroJett018_39050 [Chloroflexota bacterium]
MSRTSKPQKPVPPSVPNEYFVMVQRNYETIKRVVSAHPTREEAIAERDKRRAYTGSFNYDNAELTVITLAEAKKIFGEDWEFGATAKSKPPKPKTKTSTPKQKS